MHRTPTWQLWIKQDQFELGAYCLEKWKDRCLQRDNIQTNLSFPALKVNISGPSIAYGCSWIGKRNLMPCFVGSTCWNIEYLLTHKLNECSIIWPKFFLPGDILSSFLSWHQVCEDVHVTQMCYAHVIQVMNYELSTERWVDLSAEQTWE